MSLAEEVSDPSTMGGLCYNCPTLGESVVLVQTIEHKLCFVDMSKVVIVVSGNEIGGREINSSLAIISTMGPQAFLLPYSK